MKSPYECVNLPAAHTNTCCISRRSRHDRGRRTALKQRRCKCVSQLSAPAELCEASRQDCIDVKVLPPPQWPQSLKRGRQAGHVEGPGCDGYLWGRVTASRKGALEGGGHGESPPLLLCVHRGSHCFCTAASSSSPSNPTSSLTSLPQPQPAPGEREMSTNCWTVQPLISLKLNQAKESQIIRCEGKT